MMKKLVFIMIFFFSSFLAFTYDEKYSSGDYDYAIDNSKAIILGYYGDQTGVQIPAYIDGFPVTAIGDLAFLFRKDIVSIEIPNTVTTIGKSAFVHCESLEKILIPDSVTSIGSLAFWFCKKLERIHIPHSVSSIGYGVFRDCESLTIVVIDSNNSVYSFKDNALFDETTKTLHSYLSANKSTSYNIPKGTVFIGDAAFAGAIHLKYVEMSNSVTTLGDFAFEWCFELETVLLSDSLTTIDDYVFNNCKKLSNIVLPNSLVSMGQSVFLDCFSLVRIDFPDGITSINATTFGDCEKLENVTIPDSVTYIDPSAFYNCKNLILRVKDGSYVHLYAIENEIPFIIESTSM